MKPIIFFDTEIDNASGKIIDIGAVKSDGALFHSNSAKDFAEFMHDATYICGHNIIHHDLKYIKKYFTPQCCRSLQAIDTLFLSPLLFPTKPYHKLIKDDKLAVDDLNNPVNDSQKSRKLFDAEITAFNALDRQLKQIYHQLLSDKIEFKAFFNYLSYSVDLNITLSELIKQCFAEKICINSALKNIISQYPMELAYCLALVSSTDRYSITPPWVLKNFPEVEQIIYLLRDKPCLTGCKYCNDALDAKKGLKRYFGFDAYRSYGGEALQENAVNAALAGKSLLAVFPTGGGKSLTFQIPALMAGENSRGLTIVISPLQSLMKDQVDNLESGGITDAVTINGLLDSIERQKSFERVENGLASILYISPESLRSRTIENLLLGRRIARFVIDEAHCFSSWGQDFRVDYLYIGEFIKNLQKKKQLTDKIPISCFTATAKPKVIEDIIKFFNDQLSLKLELFRANASRTNLEYKVYNSKDDMDKYNNLRMLIETKNCPTIVYVSRTRKAYKLAEALAKDGFNAKAYHGKMDKKEKSENQNAFIAGIVQIMVATSAFGMGVDKKDVGLVIHYEISDSLENYVQEAGRAGRDENISAECFVLFNEEDLDKHFILLNQTKISIKEIQQVWRAIKEITRFRSTVSNSALEIARKAGWDENVMDIETRVTTAISALEQANYLKRGQNIPRIFANSILSKNAMEAIAKINSSSRFNEQQKMKATRIIKKLFSSKSRKHANSEEAETRIDYISDHLGIVKEDVIKIITLLREEQILADTKDLTAFIKQSDSMNRSLAIVSAFIQIENLLLPLMEEQENVFHLKELNELGIERQIKVITPRKIKTIFNFWGIKNWIKQKHIQPSNDRLVVIRQQPREILLEKQTKRHQLAKFIVDYMFKKSETWQSGTVNPNGEELVEFSVHELKEKFEQEALLFKTTISIEDIEDTLFYLSRIDAIKIEGGFLVIYNKLTINRLENNNKIQYKNDDYQQLDQFYQNRMEQIHIVGEYAQKMLEDYNDALKFVDDYFQLNYASFLNKYFPGNRKDEIKRNITPSKFRELFGSLSPRQLAIINDKQSANIVVAAGPGSGKTKLLVHKLASLYSMEDVKHEQMLMLTFSRAATTEFKKRLIDLLGNAAYFIEIKTFHAYCFDLLGRIGSLEKSTEIIKEATDKIINGEVEINRITKTVLVIDEAQDMDRDEFNLIQTLMAKNGAMRIIAVGDDDQNIYTFRGANSKYFEQFLTRQNSIKYELIENYRSKKNLVDFTNQFVGKINQRLKTMPIASTAHDNGHINIFKYQSNNLIIPLVNNILDQGIAGTTAILTKTNSEAMQVPSLLQQYNMPAQLIQSNDQFNLFNLLELRSFISELNSTDKKPITISDDLWSSAKINFKTTNGNSPNYELCKNLIKDFEQTNSKIKYYSDFEQFIQESKLEDFNSGSSEIIYVSTIHKAKGKEFDNIFLLLNKFKANTDDAIRQIYVAMTRAKNNLSIHLNNDYLDTIIVKNMTKINDPVSYPPPQHLILQLTHKEIFLNYFKNDYIQHRIAELNSGDILTVTAEGLNNYSNELVLKFSRQFTTRKQCLEQQGYQLIEAKINFIIYWQPPNETNISEPEVKIIIPELCFITNMERKI